MSEELGKKIVDCITEELVQNIDVYAGTVQIDTEAISEYMDKLIIEVLKESDMEKLLKENIRERITEMVTDFNFGDEIQPKVERGFMNKIFGGTNGQT